VAFFFCALLRLPQPCLPAGRAHIKHKSFIER
jgi:hypothetical protein